MKLVFNILILMWYLLLANTTFAFSHADTLRGSNGTGRKWWDVTHYDLNVTFDSSLTTISGHTTISFKIIGVTNDSMQIDLQPPMALDSATWHGQRLAVADEGNAHWLKVAFESIPADAAERVTIYFHGKPKQAVNPPWDGGFIKTIDSFGHPWAAVACQGLGASVWWPCKDYQGDEPDSGADMTFTIPGPLQLISNGRKIDSNTFTANGNTWHRSHWRVANPINSYDITFYIGDYVHWHDTLMGEKGLLDMDFYALSGNAVKAARQFEEAKPMLHCFEYWAGPYPFYEDGYKLVEAPYLGMEHQSAVAYGNQYLMGYIGRDRSGTDVGLKFDFIIVHESGHEWFGNSITAKDIADNWVHEGITTYLESLYAECRFGKEEGAAYCRGEWRNIRNDRPVIGSYGVNDEGSGDMYDKGAAIIYMIRVMMHDDEKFRNMLRGLSNSFYHQTVTTQQVENFIQERSGLDLKAFFDQYLRTDSIPTLHYYTAKKQLHYRFTGTVPQFTLPVTATAGNKTVTIQPTGKWQQIPWNKGDDVRFSKDYLFTVERR